MAGSSNDTNAEALKHNVDNASESERDNAPESENDIDLEEGKRVGGTISKNIQEGFGTLLSSRKATLTRTYDSTGEDAALKLSEYDTRTNPKSTNSLIDEDLAAIPPDLRLLDSIERTVTPGAFRASSGHIEPVSHPDLLGDRNPSVDSLSDYDGRDRPGFNNMSESTPTTIEATLVNDDIPDPPVLVAAVSDKIMLAEIVSVDDNVSNSRRQKDRQRLKCICLLAWLVVFGTTVVSSILITTRLKAQVNDSIGLPTPNNTKPYWNKIVTHHAFVYGGSSTCNRFEVGSVRLYCAGALEVNDDALAFLDILHTSSNATSCNHIGSNAVKCDTIGFNGSLQVGIVFSCGRSNYIDERNVAAMAFLETSNGSDCSNVSESNEIDALAFMGLGHFCKYSEKDSDVVTWKLEKNLVMEDGVKMENQCETESAEFLPASSFDYCYEADRSCTDGSKSIDDKCSVELDSSTVTDSFGKCGNMDPSTDETIEALVNLTGNLLIQTDHMFFESFRLNMGAT